MKDDFIPGGTPIKYSEHIKNNIQKKIEKSTVSSVGFKTPYASKKLQVNEEAEKLERLISFKNERTRLERQLNNLNKLIETLENE